MDPHPPGKYWTPSGTLKNYRFLWNWPTNFCKISWRLKQKTLSLLSFCQNDLDPPDENSWIGAWPWTNFFHTGWLTSKTLLTMEEHPSKITRNSAVDCHLSPVGWQIAIKNSVSNDFWSTFVHSILMFSIVPYLVCILRWWKHDKAHLHSLSLVQIGQ